LITDRTATTVGNEARNFKISSISSDVTVLSALYLSERGLLPPGWVVINLVHDSILFEAPAEASDEECRGVRSLVEQAAQHILRPDFPYEAEVKVGQSWGALTAL
jgi:DNA polymerase I-like protein with 3'-5' exonuclease and polymerase domains